MLQIELMCLDYIELNGIHLYVYFDRFRNHYCELNQILGIIDVVDTDFTLINSVATIYVATIYEGLTNYAKLTGERMGYVNMDDVLMIWSYYAPKNPKALDFLLRLSQIGMYSKIRELSNIFERIEW